MRITRAAKIAAIPLTALVLVALIACQGPAGPAGADGRKGDTGKAGTDGTQGPPGKDAPHPLASMIIDTVYFSLPQAAGTDDDPVPEIDVDVSTGFTGGMAEGRTYKLGTVANSGQFTGFSYELDGSTLKLKMDQQAVPDGTDPIEDVTIPIQATDTNGAVATTTVIVRGNVVPVVANAGDALTLTVGLQAAPTADGDDDDMDPDDYDIRTASSLQNAEFTCVMLNECSLKLTGLGDRNRDDTNVWRFYNTDADSIMVRSADDGVMIKGLKAATAVVSVYVWAEDAGGLPETDEDGAYRDDNSDTADIDESKFPAGARTIQVTVDPPPNLGEIMMGQDVSLPAQTLKSSDDTRVLGTIYNDPSTEGITLTQEEHEGIVNISFSTGGQSPTISDTSDNASAAYSSWLSPRT